MVWATASEEAVARASPVARVCKFFFAKHDGDRRALCGAGHRDHRALCGAGHRDHRALARAAAHPPQPVASVAPVQDMMSVAEEMVEPHVPRADGTYHGPMRVRYVLAATADPRVISARIFQGGRAITGNFEMRNTGALAAWRQPVWEGALPRHVHGGAMLRLEFDQGFGAFFSTARGKPRRRFVKQSVVAPVAPVPAADGLRRPHDEMSAQDLEGCWLYAGVWLFPPLPIVAFSRHEARSPTHYMTSGWSPCLPVIPMFAHYLKRGDHWEGYMDPGGGSGEPGDGAPLCGAKRVMRNRNLIYATPGSFWGFVRRLC